MMKEIEFDIIMIDKMAYIWTEREVDINIKSIYKNRLNLQLLIDKQNNFEFINTKKKLYKNKYSYGLISFKLFFKVSYSLSN